MDNPYTRAIRNHLVGCAKDLLNENGGDSLYRQAIVDLIVASTGAGDQDLARSEVLKALDLTDSL